MLTHDTLYMYVQYFTNAVIEPVKVNLFLVLRINFDSKIVLHEKFNIIIYMYDYCMHKIVVVLMHKIVLALNFMVLRSVKLKAP